MFELAEIQFIIDAIIANIVSLSQIFKIIEGGAVCYGMFLLGTALWSPGKRSAVEEAIMTFNYELLKMKREKQSK